MLSFVKSALALSHELIGRSAPHFAWRFKCQRAAVVEKGPTGLAVETGPRKTIPMIGWR
jgi:hypothetical protein